MGSWISALGLLFSRRLVEMSGLVAGRLGIQKIGQAGRGIGIGHSGGREHDGDPRSCVEGGPPASLPSVDRSDYCRAVGGGPAGQAGLGPTVDRGDCGLFLRAGGFDQGEDMGRFEEGEIAGSDDDEPGAGPGQDGRQSGQRTFARVAIGDRRHPERAAGGAADGDDRIDARGPESVDDP